MIFVSRLSLIIFLLLTFLVVSTKNVFASFTICQDNFSNAQTCVWTKIPSQQNVFNRETGVFSSKVDSNTPPDRYFLLTGNPYDSDYIFNFHIRGISGFHKKVVFRYQDNNNYYLVDIKSSLNNDDSWIYLYSVKNAQEKLLTRVKYSNQIENWYFVEIRIVDNHFTVMIFDRPLIDYYDENPLLNGSAGFAADGAASEENVVWYNFIELTDIAEKSPVIFIPGLGASWNIPAMLSCNLNPSSEWTLAPYADLYQRLINTFLQNGYVLNKDFYIYAYDWRQSMNQQGINLKAYLDSIGPSQQFNIVSHSLGGLVVRSYLQQNPSSHRLKKVITLGSPHQGTVLAYPIWEAGEVWTTDQTQRLATSFLINHCRSPLKLSSKDIVHAIAPSIKDLLPTFNYLKNKGQKNFIDVNSLKEQNSWLINNSFSSNFYNTQFVTISGHNNDTIDYLEVTPPSISENLLGIWPDGIPVITHNINDGDGTVLQNSSLLKNSITQTLNNTNHGGLVYTDLGIKTIFKYLNQPAITVASYQPASQITDLKLEIPGLANTNWKKYTLKIRN